MRSGAPQQFLYFFPEPQPHGSLRPGLLLIVASGPELYPPHLVRTMLRQAHGSEGRTADSARSPLSHYTDAIDGRIEETLEESSRTCEFCCQPGKQRETGGWVRAVCAEHAHNPEKK